MSIPKTPRKTKSATRDLFESAAGHPEAYLVAHVDGGARGNPGPAGYGVVVEDKFGHPITQLSEFLGHRTNNYAEYRGLLAAMRYAVGHDFRSLEVLSDSELMVRQMNGQYKVKNADLKLLWEEAQNYRRQLKWFAIRHVRRELNREADELANAAMDRRK